MTISDRELSLLRSGYVLSYAGAGTADGRTAEVVTAERPDGTLAAKFWLDGQTKLPLRREVLVDGSRILSEDAFLSLSVGASQLHGMPAADARPWTGQLTVGGLAALAAKGWPLPGDTVGGLALFQSSETPSKSGKIVEL